MRLSWLPRALTCAAFASWCFLNTWVELAEGKAAYFARRDPFRETIPAVLLWEIVISAGLFAAWECCRRAGIRSRWAQRAFLAACALPAGIGAVALLRAFPLDLHFVVQWRWFWPAAAALLLPAAIAAWRHPDAFGRAIRSALLYSWPVLLVMHGQAAWRHRHPAEAFADGPAAPRIARAAPPIRVVWVVFDELSQAIAFDRRPPGLPLPEFDRLRGESLFATFAYSPAPATVESIPSLLTGEHVRESEPRGPRSLWLQTDAHPNGMDFSTAPNVFDQARALGFDSAIAGWFHPYGRLLHRSVSADHWTAGLLLPGIEEPAEPLPLTGAAAFRLARQVETFPLIGHFPGFFPRAYQRREFAARLLTLLRHAEDLAADPSFGLVFLHIPAPHPPPVFDWRTGRFADRGPNGYAGSVALADLALGHIRRAIDRSGASDVTALVVSADHGWRMTWRGGPDWTAEDEAISHGVDTSGIPFLVKLPGQQTPLEHHDPFDTVNTAGIVLRILSGELRDPRAIARAMAPP